MKEKLDAWNVPVFLTARRASQIQNFRRILRTLKVRLWAVHSGIPQGD